MVTLTIFLNTWTGECWLFTIYVFRLFLLIFSLPLSLSDSSSSLSITLCPSSKDSHTKLKDQGTKMAAITCSAPLIRIPPNHRTYVHGSTMGDVRWMGRRQWSWRWIPPGPARSSTRLEILVVLCLFFVVQLCPFFQWIGADRWFRCSGRGWIDIVCDVVERRWSGGWVVRYWSATLVRWVLLLRCSAVGWGWGRPESESETKTKIKEND